VRSLLRKKPTDETPDNRTRTDSPYAGLGIFSPMVDAEEPDPVQETRRLAELEEIFVRSKKLESLDDVPFIIDQVKNGNIVLLDITHLNDGKDQTHLELKRIIERIRGETRSYRADMAIVNDSCVIVAPSFIRF
jgi:SepF-like predicted cell division protein (DUF552 family)